MSTANELELQASALANHDAICAVIACLANTGALNSLMFKEALAAIKDINIQTEAKLHDHSIYEAQMEMFIAAAEQRL
ncbi:hypothetical protein [Pseudomonas syringae]|uniref:hypothetical protein n=1 Tax=Pseudomonas syringae TaxID=317 RepID=UPI000CDB2961|nr:hypothetical protein [Pseudomonas syringae]POP79260.1 hypothetical protein CXB37_03895 [Pseudomonas syringae pv. syringae]